MCFSKFNKSISTRKKTKKNFLCGYSFFSNRNVLRVDLTHIVFISLGTRMAWGRRDDG